MRAFLNVTFLRELKVNRLVNRSLWKGYANFFFPFICLHFIYFPDKRIDTILLTVGASQVSHLLFPRSSILSWIGSCFGDAILQTDPKVLFVHRGVRGDDQGYMSLSPTKVSQLNDWVEKLCLHSWISWHEHIQQLIWMTWMNFLITVGANNTARQGLRLISCK